MITLFICVIRAIGGVINGPADLSRYKRYENDSYVF